MKNETNQCIAQSLKQAEINIKTSQNALTVSTISEKEIKAQIQNYENDKYNLSSFEKHKFAS